jgi:hypothetical protein
MKYQPMWKAAGGWSLTEQLDLALQPGLFLFLPEAFLDGSRVFSGAGEPASAVANCRTSDVPAPRLDLVGVSRIRSHGTGLGV